MHSLPPAYSALASSILSGTLSGSAPNSFQKAATSLQLPANTHLFLPTISPPCGLSSDVSWSSKQHLHLKLLWASPSIPNPSSLFYFPFFPLMFLTFQKICIFVILVYIVYFLFLPIPFLQRKCTFASLMYSKCIPTRQGRNK